MIDIEKTISTFGHDPKLLKPFSSKKVYVNCDKCNKSYFKRMSQASNKENGIQNDYCFSCSCIITGNKRKDRTDIEYIGKKINKWKILERVSQTQAGIPSYKCECECGRQFIRRVADIIGGYSKQCYYCGSGNKYCIGDLTSSFYNHIGVGARNRGINFEVSIEFLWDLFVKQEGKCALTNLDIVLNKSYKNYENNLCTASLDRIDPAGHYTEDNVQWVHKDLNWMKQRFNQKYFIDMCKLVANKFKDDV